MPDAILYCRVSTRQQAEEGTSLESQRDACLKHAEQKGYSVPEEYVLLEDASGANLDRPLLTRGRELVKSGQAKALVCYSTDRLARNPIHIAIIAEECQKAGAKLLFLTEPLDTSPEGQLIQYVKGYAAQLEREKIKDRTIRGKRARALAGQLPTGSAGLYGYDYDKTKGVRRIDEEEARVVRMIFNWVDEEDLTLGRVAIRLAELGIPSPKGSGRWGRSTVGRIVKNPAYSGLTYANMYKSVLPKNPQKGNARYKNTRREFRPREEWIPLPDATPAVVSRELFDRVRERLACHQRMASRNARHQYLLRGHVECGRCGRRFYGEPMRGYRYYRCAGRRRYVSIEPCRNDAHEASELEALVLRELRRLLIDPALILAEVEKRREGLAAGMGHSDDLAFLDRQLVELAGRERRLLRAYTLGRFSDEDLDTEHEAIRREREAILSRKATLAERFEQLDDLEVTERAAQEFCGRVSRNLDAFGYDDWRLALRALDTVVRVDGQQVTLHGVIPIDARICSIASPQS
ncbi:MAG: recombinase family protein [Dehalococcoidia bacterium]|nr:recombinase family protein [Dehalococcoidia bacterium]